MSVSAVLFDLEGVLLRAKTHDLMPGAVELFALLRDSGVPFRVITNNTIQTPEEILVLLSERGLFIEKSQLLTPFIFLSNELLNFDSAMILGSSNLEKFVRDYGIDVRETSDVNAVICGGSYSISNERLFAAHTAISENKSSFLCLHRNRVFNDASGIQRPDIGSIVVALEYSTGKSAKTLGKPSADYFIKASEQWHCSANEILLISDDPISDLNGGHSMGYQTAFVATGKYSPDVLNDLDIVPNYAWKDLTEAISELKIIFK